MFCSVLTLLVQIPENAGWDNLGNTMDVGVLAPCIADPR